MRTQLTNVRANSIRPLLTATLALAITFTLSCSGGDDNGSGGNNGSGGGGNGGGNNGANEGLVYTYGIENLTESSFTTVYNKSYNCEYADGTVEEEIEKEVINYSINGKTLSAWGVEFNGNSNSLIGTWTREAYSASCDEDDYRDRCGDYLSKLVFTQNTLAITYCKWKSGQEGTTTNKDGTEIKWKATGCNTREWMKGTETVIEKEADSLTEGTLTYKGKTCTWGSGSESEERAACAEAYNKAKAEGKAEESEVVQEYYYEFLNKDTNKCLKDNNFPEWLD